MYRKNKRGTRKRHFIASSFKLAFFVAIVLFTKKEFDQMDYSKEQNNKGVEEIVLPENLLNEPMENNKEDYNATASLLAKANIK